ncbi:carbonic anhydrase [Penicillium argentinense]|uniref:Carbonic anhydrase n=1 Tax=Penicillium argentinense TaxID=1131581 RepID=A0A9W9KN57_9EURO|nr:carbonic anhydrase [Penicillium argentinense]KAJ5111617.1 carbonic anhydrase [Penicillium argentinense]
MSLRFPSLYRSLHFVAKQQARVASTFSPDSLLRNVMIADQFSNFLATPLRHDFIPSLGKPMQQVLWIGCSDSCFQETTALNLLPDEMLVHRNLGNMLIDGDLSSEITIKHAVSDLKVRGDARHASRARADTIAGKTYCGVRSLWMWDRSGRIKGRLGWTVAQVISSEGRRDRAFVEMNVLDQLHSLRKFPEVADATKAGLLQIHGIVYDTKSGQALKLADGLQEGVNIWPGHETI